MRYYQLRALFLTTTCCLVGYLSSAQQGGAVDPIAPRSPRVFPQEKAIDMPAKSGTQPTYRAFVPAQDPNQSAVVKKWPQPIYILDSSVIIGDLSDFKPSDIETLAVYKDKSPDVPSQWTSLTVNGIIALTMKSKVKLKSWSFKQIGRRVGIKGPISYSVNGLPVTGADLRIATNAIGEIKITRATPTAPGTQVDITISTAQPSKSTYPPGTIMIRGTAAL
ncbi:hypothetical protein [Hymenobacter volaticus]|uniref:Uncharacterized protein n=1 Tax=Hymenobacter volaticus TaxID=2932254 RepID=A0ABY4G4A9_9BACT|nr:hypothetical protein [Hymenobacter volaticus]UOQ65729.1 hypothetical protein MUN86_19700 [Hymenobacter volaticus]